MAKWCRMKKFTSETGETEDAVRSNIASGMWPEGMIWRKGPNGRVYLNTRGFDKWVEGQVYAPQRKAPSGSASNTEESGVVSDLSSHRRRRTTSTSPDSRQP